MLTLRTMTVEDIPTGLELCRHAGWNQLEADWRLLLALAPDGCFIAEEGGRPCGSGTATMHGTRTAWIGMILVHPDFRNRGIGTAIMDRLIAHLRARNVESIKLDATDLGRPVYLKLGFRDERPIHRYTGAKPGSAKGPTGLTSLTSPTRPTKISLSPPARPVDPTDWPAIAAIDRRAFDADRLELLKIFAGEGISAVVGQVGNLSQADKDFTLPLPGPAGGLLAEHAPSTTPRSGQVGNLSRAYGFARKGHNASFVGPVVATDPEAARAVVEALLAQLPDGQVFWDILPDNAAARQLAESLGFAPARLLIRMYLGSVVNPGDVQLVYGAAGFELG